MGWVTGVRPLLFLSLALFVFAGVTFAALQKGAAQTSASPQASAGTPIVFAAASLKASLDAIAAEWKVQTGKSAAISYAASGELAKQMEQGSHADLFLAASLAWMDQVDKNKLIKADTRRTLLSNTLVLIQPAEASSSLKIESGFDLAGEAADGKIAVCSLVLCPAGLYAKEALEKLGIWQNTEGKLVQTEHSHAALALVANGEARFGIVYGTDAKAEPKVRIVGTFPSSVHTPIVYSAALLAASNNRDAAFFLSYLRSQAATKIFKDHGFVIK